jgi:AraC-like DNA-binding protein
MSTNDCYIRATALIGIQDLVEQAGGDMFALLADAGIDPKALTNVDSVMSYAKHANLLELAAQQLGRPSFGLECAIAAPDHLPFLGSIAMFAYVSRTMRELVGAAREYMTFQSNAFDVELMEDHDSGLATIRYKLNAFSFPPRQQTEVALANVVRLARHTSSRHDLNPTVVRFQHGRPRDLSLHDQLFRCPIEFGAEHDEVSCDISYLDLPTNGSLNIFKPLVGMYMKHRIGQMARYDQSMATTVELAIRSVIGTGQTNVDFISEQLGLTPKKLQRLLANEGTTFSDILERVRSSTASEILAGSDASVARIAGLLDYSATAPFTLAFKRWTGQSPLAFRKAQRVSRAPANRK